MPTVGVGHVDHQEVLTGALTGAGFSTAAMTAAAAVAVAADSGSLLTIMETLSANTAVAVKASDLVYQFNSGDLTFVPTVGQLVLVNVQGEQSSSQDASTAKDIIARITSVQIGSFKGSTATALAHGGLTTSIKFNRLLTRDTLTAVISSGAHFTINNMKLLYHAKMSNMTEKINVYSFALKPEEHQPSGTCNFSRIDNAKLDIKTSSGMAPSDNIYAVNYNVLRIMSGMGGLAYSN